MPKQEDGREIDTAGRPNCKLITTVNVDAVCIEDVSREEINLERLTDFCQQITLGSGSHPELN